MTTQEERLDAIVADAVAGDRDALREVLETIRPIVVRYCRARVGTLERSGLSADDVAQEVCLAAVMALPRYRDRGRPFLAFVYGIAAHKVADAYRAAGRDLSYATESVPERSSTEAGPEQAALDADSVSRMRALLETLPDKQREILILRVVVGLSAEETARAVGSTAGAVRVVQHRALSRLKSMIGAEDATMSEPFDEARPHEVARSERFLDALANREPVDVTDGEPGDRELAGLLEGWRDDLRGRPTGELCGERDAVAVLDRGLAQRRRARRRMALVSAAAAAVVAVAAVGAVLGQVKPGDALYGVRTTILGEPASVHDDKIAVSAEADLDQVEQMIALGQWDQAHDKLAAVGEHVQTVKDAGRKRGLIEKVNRLNAKVVLRNGHPAAGPAPVITMTPNPFGG